MGGTDSASGQNNGLRWSPQLLRACRPGIRPLFGQPLLLLAFVLVREVEAWSPLARPLAVAVVLEAEGGLEAGVAQQSTCVLCVCVCVLCVPSLAIYAHVVETALLRTYMPDGPGFVLFVHL